MFTLLQLGLNEQFLSFLHSLKITDKPAKTIPNFFNIINNTTH